MIADEAQFADTPYLASDNTVINNLFSGCSQNITFWQGKKSGSGLRNTIIANNTLADASAEVDNGSTAALVINQGTHANTKIVNNIFQQNNFVVAYVANNSGLQFSHNLWSRTPPSIVASSTDVIGDPKLVKTGPTAPGQLTPDWFNVSSNSPAINKGANLAIVATDFNDIPRPLESAYDIGAFEINSTVPTTKLADANNDSKVNGLDYAIWLSNFGKSLTGANNGDFNADNKVNGLDYAIWLGNFGK
jgi:hypothetical protein